MLSLTNSTGDASTNRSDGRNRPVTIVKIQKRTHPFAMIDARALNDERISWKAKGLHAYLMSKPNDWRVIFSDLVKHATDGPYSVRATLNELRRFGYARLEAVKNGRLFCGSCWTVYEWPAQFFRSYGDDGFPNLGKIRISGKSDCRQNRSLGKIGVSGKPNATNNDSTTKNKIDNEIDGKSTTLSTTVPTARAKHNAASGFVSQSYQNQHKGQPARNHVKFPEFGAWCRNKGGQPTESGFWKWLSRQKPQWKNRLKKSEETGYVLHGKFFTREQANQMAIKDPELLTKFRPAVKRDGRTQAVKRQ